MGGTLLNKRYIKRKKTEDREDGEVVDGETTVVSSSTGATGAGGTVAVVQTTDSREVVGAPRKRRKPAGPSPKTDTTTATHKDAKHRVSFHALAPTIVSIDGLGSQIIQRFRDSIWYTKKDYRTFWKDRVETVRVWHSLYGGIEDDEYVARMLDDTFTIRGLENYVCDPAEAAENLDPKKNRYVQAVLRAQRTGRVDAHALHEEVKDITEASLRKAQALAILDAQAVLPARPHFAFELNQKPIPCAIPNSPNSVLFDVNQSQQYLHQQQHQASSRKMNSFDKKLLQHMDEGQRRQIIIEHRRNSVQLYQAEEQRKSELQNQRRLSILGAAGGPQMRRQSLSGVPTISCAPPIDSSSGHDMSYGKLMNGQRDSTVLRQQLSTEARRPTMTLKQHDPRPVSGSYPRDSMSLGPRPSRRQSISDPQSSTFASPPARRGAQLVAARYTQQQLQYQQSMEGRMFPVSLQQRRDSVYGTMITTPQSMALVQMQRFLQRDPSTYTEMIGGFPGMRRDSLAGHYEHS